MSEDAIDRMIQELTNGNISSSETKDVEKVKKDLEVDIEDINSIAENLVKMTKDDRAKADKIFEMFYTAVGVDKDRTEASKEAISRALELKIEASKNLIELLKIKTKANEIKTNIGLAFNVSSGKKAGINLENIRKETKKKS
jgi:hypothetical protein